MPFLLVIIGLLMIVTGARNTHVAFARQVQSDFTGQGNFLTWIVSIGAVGALGYFKPLEEFSKYFMALIILGLLLANKGFFAQFSKALQSGGVAPVALADNSAPVTEKSAASMSQGELDAQIKKNETGLWGNAPKTAGEAKFNGWMNYFLGLK